MHRFLFLLTLVSTLSATPLRQAEAASDFAAEPGHCAQLDTTDGGVGDDRAESIQTRSPRLDQDASPGTCFDQPEPATSRIIPLGSLTNPPDPPPNTLTPHSRRRARLQRYQF